MTTRTQIGCLDTELRRAWILDVVDAMTIGADRHIGVILLDQRRTMNTVFILSIDVGMAMAARCRNFRARLGWRLNVMRAVTIGANGRFGIAAGSRPGMHAILRQSVIG